MELLWINCFEYTHPAFVSGQLVSMKLYLLHLSHLPKVSVCCMFNVVAHLNIYIPSIQAFVSRPRHALGRRRYRHVRGLAQLHGLRKSWHKIHQLHQLHVSLDADGIADYPLQKKGLEWEPCGLCLPKCQRGRAKVHHIPFLIK